MNGTAKRHIVNGDVTVYQRTWWQAPPAGAWTGLGIQNGDPNTLYEGICPTNGWPDLLRLVRPRHSARFNFLFCDSHTEALRLDQLWNVRRPDVMARWNNDHLPHRELPTWRQ